MGKIRTSIVSIIFITCVSAHYSYAQNTLFTPLEFEKAYQNKTRSYDGNPGVNYWQNSADFDIEAEIIPEKSLLRGKESIVYFNNSPDTLFYLVIQLYQDMYKKGNKRKKYVIPSDITDGTHISLLKVDKEEFDLNDKDKVSRRDGLLKLKLDKPVLPKTTAQLEMMWDYHIPEKTFIRTARFDSSSFFIAYWFPRLAVYDDVFGWDIYGYDGMHEFNNDYGNFSVKIKVPDDYIVWSNGELKNPDAVYSNDIIQKLSQLGDNTQLSNIIVGSSSANNMASGVTEWVFSATNTKDFAFGVSNHHTWDAIRFQISDGTEKQVNVIYHPDSKEYFEPMPLFLTKCIEFFSDEMPGVNYPYAEYTAFQGLKKGWHNAIEFPAISNYAYHSEDTLNLSMFAHELAHIYFPFYVNINEAQFLWLEEGLTTYLELTIMRDLLGLKKFDRWESSHPLDIYSGRFNDIPPFTSSILYEWGMVTQTAYYRPSYAFIILEDLLGKDLFKDCLKKFIVRWAGKRPIPHDLFYTFNDVTGQNLNWFWKPWFFEFGYPDVAIECVETGVITVRKNGVIPVPVHLKVTYDDDSYEEIYKSAEVWQSGNDLLELNAKKGKKINKVVLNDKFEIPDVNRTNNVYSVGD
ncbi:hypothetical protein EYV94_00980 [Puteibacter caeruleilacunae]|nr:hypothetical protein EYV94_00980 [Puteibacter caeruleilacunae]